MGIINVSLPNDGETADAADLNNPINTIVTEINGNLDNDNIKSGAAISGAKLADATVTNAKLATTTGEPGGAWESWTPTWTNVSGGTLNFAKYKQIGKTVHFKIKYTLAGAGVSSVPIFTTPTTIQSDSATAIVDIVNGQVQFFDSSTGFYYVGSLTWGTSTTLRMYAWSTGTASTITLATPSSTIPFTWATGDVLEAWGTYEAA